MNRLKLLIEYDGSEFVGWQRQAEGESVQQCLERAIAAFSGEHVTVTGAGRTDSGVRALGQVAHVALARRYPAQKICDAINHHLRPRPIAVLAVEPVGADFHARFSAVERGYLYRIVVRRALAGVLHADQP